MAWPQLMADQAAAIFFNLVALGLYMWHIHTTHSVPPPFLLWLKKILSTGVFLLAAYALQAMSTISEDVWPFLRFALHICLGLFYHHVNQDYVLGNPWLTAAFVSQPVAVICQFNFYTRLGSDSDMALKLVISHLLRSCYQHVWYDQEFDSFYLLLPVSVACGCLVSRTKDWPLIKRRLMGQSDRKINKKEEQLRLEIDLLEKQTRELEQKLEELIVEKLRRLNLQREAREKEKRLAEEERVQKTAEEERVSKMEEDEADRLAAV